MIYGGNFGPSLCGKTTLAKHLSRAYFRQKGMRTLALNLHLEDFGPQAYVTANEEEFWRMVWARRNHLVIVDDASATINRQRELMPVFTMLRHNEHRLLVCGHSGSDLLPGMRKNFDTLYLFQQDEDSAKEWSKIFPKRGCEQSVDLEQYEFLLIRSFKKPQRLRLTI